MRIYLDVSRYRILHVTTESGWRGGEQQVFYLLRGLRRKGYKVRLAAPSASVLSLRAEERGIAVYPFSAFSDLDFFAARQLSRILLNYRPRIVHAHTGRAHAIAWMASKLASSYAALIVSRRVAFPLRNSFINRIKYRQPDLLLPISEAAAQPLRALRIPENRIRIVHEGVDPKRWTDRDADSLREELELAPEAFVIGNVAYCDAVKNQAMILDAAPAVLERHPQAVFLLVGDGPERAKLMRRVTQLGLDGKVIFTGFREDLGRFYSLFDAFVITSSEEGLCTSIMDAQMFRNPVIATRVGGIPEIIQDGETGLLIPSGDAVALADALNEVIDNETLRIKIEERGFERVQANFAVDVMVEKTLEAYKIALERKGYGIIKIKGVAESSSLNIQH